MPKRKKKRTTYNRVCTRLKIPTPSKPKKSERSQRVYELDVVFSWWLRLLYSDKKGVCECYTCGKKMLWTQIQNGHWITRGCYRYRRDERNCRPQCNGCNIFKQGNYIIYTMKMMKENGKRCEQAMINKNKVFTIKTHDLVDQILRYEQAILKLVKSKSVKAAHILK